MVRNKFQKRLPLARMSHEIRTPMNAVIGMSELLQRDYGTPKGLEHTSGIRNARLSLLAVINDLKRAQARILWLIGVSVLLLCVLFLLSFMFLKSRQTSQLEIQTEAAEAERAFGTAGTGVKAARPRAS